MFRYRIGPADLNGNGLAVVHGVRRIAVPEVIENQSAQSLELGHRWGHSGSRNGLGDGLFVLAAGLSLDCIGFGFIYKYFLLFVKKMTLFYIEKNS
jgi:hypothetical protein